MLDERSAFDGLVAGLMQAVAEGGRGVGAEVDRERVEDADRLEGLSGQLAAKVKAAKALEEEVEEYKRQVASSEEALSALRRAQESEAEKSRAEVEQERKRDSEAVRARLEKAANAEKEAKRSLEEHQVEVDTLRRKARLLEASQADRFEAEKTRIVSILEAGFAQRERLAVEKVRAEVEAAGREEVERAVREQEAAVGRRLEVRFPETFPP